jgi:cation transport ATPase
MTSLDDSTTGSNVRPREGAADISQRAALDTPLAEARQSDHEQRLGIIAPVDPRGRHELLRLAAGLAPFLHSANGAAIAKAAAALDIEPAHIERVVSSQKDLGVIALVDGVLYALGRQSFLEDIGVRPHVAEVRVAERIERSGEMAYFIVAVARAHCLGVFGAPSQPEQPDSAGAL